MDELRDLLADLSRRSRTGIAWWRRRSRAQRVLMIAGLVVLAAVVSPTVRGTLVGLVVAVFGLVLLVALVAALTVGLLGRIVRRHPLADLAAGYLIGRRHARRRMEQYGPGYLPPSSYYYPPSGYPPPIPGTTRRPATRRRAGRRRRLGHPGPCQPHMCAATDVLRTGAVLTGERGPKVRPLECSSLVVIVGELGSLALVAQRLQGAKRERPNGDRRDPLRGPGDPAALWGKPRRRPPRGRPQTSGQSDQGGAMSYVIRVSGVWADAIASRAPDAQKTMLPPRCRVPWATRRCPLLGLRPPISRSTPPAVAVEHPGNTVRTREEAPMGQWEIIQEGNKTTIKKKHPFWGAFVVFCGIVLIVDGIAKTPWLIVPTILILGGMVWLAAKGRARAKAKEQPPSS